ncbi:hypothetical protein BJ138DRAFT_1217555 [Hygrophoropsis aurantiaca]|uniref:Uncharacterized protein n=1 Tax=Hygrophoropsis aurantiaca TaxID=72124 RepID=A0ACB8A1Q2_9AGAM|nr:hypothetical protein BJ138DRAFT_1217555 [Hygrophoropsis aurantiaca]
MLRKFPTHVLRRRIIPAAHKVRHLSPFPQSLRPIFNNSGCLPSPFTLAAFPKLLKTHIHVFLQHLKDCPGAATEFTIEGISTNDYDQLMKDLEQDKDGEWENVRIDLSRDTLMVKVGASLGHEIIHEIITFAQGLPINYASPLPKLDSTVLKANPISSGITNAKFMFGGTANILLADGTHSPDMSIYPVVDHSTNSSSDSRPAILTRALQNSTPTVVFEVGYSQPTASLNCALARAIGPSMGAVQLAIGIKVSHYNMNSGGKATEATATAWSISSVQFLESYKGPTDILIPSESVPCQVPQEYVYVCETESGLIKVVIGQVQEFNNLPGQSGGDIVILNRHLYREPEPSLDDSAIAFTIPVPIIREVIQLHERQQTDQDIVKKLGAQIPPYKTYQKLDEWVARRAARYGPGMVQTKVGRDSKEE